MTNTTSGGPAPSRSRQFRRWAPVVAIVAVIAVVVAIVVAGGDDGDGSATPTTGGPSTSAGGTTAPTTDLVPGEDVISFPAAQEAGIVDDIDWGERCDVERGTVAIPDYFAADCYAPFTADNGGATDEGVTGDSIKVVWFLDRDDDPILDYITGPLDYDDTNEQSEATMRGFLEMYETYYETYGRSIDLEVVVNEGGSQDPVVARAMATRIAEEIKPFMVWGGPTLAGAAFGEELAARGILWLSLGGVDQDLARANAPLLLGIAKDTDQSRVLLAEYIGKRLAGHNAEHSGDFQDQERRFAYLYIETSDLSRQTAESFRDRLADEYGVELADMIPYTLDPATIQEQAATIIGRLKERGITSVIFAGDPIAPGDFTREATAQEYFPEWVLAGSALVDTTVFARTYDQEQWQHAFGMSDGVARTSREVAGYYFLYRWFFGETPPADEQVGLIGPWPAVTYAVLQGLGPNVTREGFAQTLFDAEPTARGGITVPSLSWGSKGVWPDDLEPDYNGVDDVTEIWWDADAVGIDELEDEGVGMYRYVDGGRRYLPGEWPDTPPNAFIEDGSVTIYEERPASETPPGYEPLRSG
jgi:hypothetical protein